MFAIFNFISELRQSVTDFLFWGYHDADPENHPVTDITEIGDEELATDLAMTSASSLRSQSSARREWNCKLTVYYLDFFITVILIKNMRVCKCDVPLAHELHKLT